MRSHPQWPRRLWCSRVQARRCSEASRRARLRSGMSPQCLLAPVQSRAGPLQSQRLRAQWLRHQWCRGQSRRWRRPPRHLVRLISRPAKRSRRRLQTRRPRQHLRRRPLPRRRQLWLLLRHRLQCRRRLQWHPRKRHKRARCYVPAGDARLTLQRSGSGAAGAAIVHGARRQIAVRTLPLSMSRSNGITAGTAECTATPSTTARSGCGSEHGGGSAAAVGPRLIA